MTIEPNGPSGTWMTCCAGVAAITAIPLAILGGLAGAGSLSVIAMGGVAIGFGVLRLPSQNVLQGITLIVLGILALTGVVTGPVVGFVAMGFACLDILITCALSSCCSAGLGAQAIGHGREHHHRGDDW